MRIGKWKLIKNERYDALIKTEDKLNRISGEHYWLSEWTFLGPFFQHILNDKSKYFSMTISEVREKMRQEYNGDIKRSEND